MKKQFVRIFLGSALIFVTRNSQAKNEKMIKALQEGDAERVHTLISSGADVNLREGDWTPGPAEATSGITTNIVLTVR
ncbi:hypothetical protein MYX84_01365 [Acidobacteria bacterium AH-259-O06]|nr:hypothetical protein [Acidobacteria bacterium AH-259-O06]